MSHTPGPWALDEYRQIVGGKYASPICELTPASMMAGSITEFDGNASLIAAAPNLLAALEMVKTRFDQQMKDKSVSFSVADYKVVARAINKARGE